METASKRNITRQRMPKIKLPLTLIKTFVSFSYFAVILLLGFYFFSMLGQHKVTANSSFQAHVFKDFYPSLSIAFLLLLWFPKTPWHKWRNTEIEHRVFVDPVMLQFVTATSLTLGIYASVTSAAILQWVTPVADNGGVVLGEAKFGVEYIPGIALLLFYCLIKHGSATSKTRAKEQQEQEQRAKDIEDKQSKRVDELEKVIRLAPPGQFPAMLASYSDILEDYATETFLDTYSKYVQQSPADKNLASWNDMINKQMEFIRSSLAAFVKLASSYDNATVGVSSPITYRANLMLKVQPEHSSIYDSLNETESYDKRFFIEFNAQPKYLLILNKTYSVAIDDPDSSIHVATDKPPHYQPKSFPSDESVKNAMFPVYWDEAKATHKSYNMFGAPEAIATCHPQFIPSTTNAADKLEGKGFPHHICTEAKTYYTNDRKGLSIVSLPLTSQRFLDNSLKPENIHGVVNIYRNAENMFSSDEAKNDKFRAFSYLTLPLQISLSRMMRTHVISLKIKPKQAHTGSKDKNGLQ